MALAFGEYAVAPGGQYTFFADEHISHNPHTYLWFFAGGFGTIDLVVQASVFSGMLYALGLVPGAGIISALAFSELPFADAIARILTRRLWLVILILAALFWGLGLYGTLQAGVNPGICC